MGPLCKSARRPQLAIGTEIIFGHPRRSKSFFEPLPHRAAIIRQDFRQRCDGFFFIFDNLAGNAVLDDLRGSTRNGTPAPGCRMP